MYLQFYGFNEAPFNLTPDSKFLFLSHRHQEALAALLFGVQERKGFICLTGEIGCGKTTLCRAMMSQLDPEKVKTCVVLNSYLSDVELLKTINEGYGLSGESDSKKSLIDLLNNFLIEEFSAGNNVVLIIDESQNLRPETLEQIRMISNLETETAKLIQIIMVGQPELRRTLALPELEQLTQRITVRYHITPLDEKELPDYIKHRLMVAEPQVEVDFSPQAFRLIYHYSQGVPRRINVICDRCLLVGYTQGTFEIDDRIVQQSVSELRGETGGYGEGQARPSASDIGLIGPSKAMVWMGRLATALVGLLVIALGVWLGIFLNQRRVDDRQLIQTAQATDDALKDFPLDEGEVVSTVDSGKTVPTQAADPAAQVEAAPEAATPTPEPTPEVTPEITPEVTPTPKPTPRPTPVLYEDWQNDTNDILRVRTPQLAEAACTVMLVREWNIIIDLENFRNAPPAEVAQYDLLAMVKKINFEAMETDKFKEALRMNVPFMVYLEEGDKKQARVGLVLSMRGDVLEWVDPLRGRRMVKRGDLEPEVRRAVVLFKDAKGLTGTSIGEESERVKTVQQWLATQGLYERKIDGKFGQGTREAIRQLQRREGLEESGVIDAPTAALINAGSTLRRPRLY